MSPDMLLEQSYNADAKEESGLDGITWHQNGESFGAIARRYLSNLLEDIPKGLQTFTSAATDTVLTVSRQHSSNTDMASHSKRGCRRLVASMQPPTHKRFSRFHQTKQHSCTFCARNGVRDEGRQAAQPTFTLAVDSEKKPKVFW